MKTVFKIVGMVIWLSFASGCSTVNSRAVSSQQIETEVRSAFAGLVEAANALSAERYLAFFDQDKFTGLNADGTVWHSIKDLKALILPGFAMMKESLSLEFDQVKVTVINQTTAILVNQYKQTVLLKSGGIVKQSGGGTQVWSKSSGAWKLVSVSGSASRGE